MRELKSMVCIARAKAVGEDYQCENVARFMWRAAIKSSHKIKSRRGQYPSNTPIETEQRATQRSAQHTELESAIRRVLDERDEHDNILELAFESLFSSKGQPTLMFWECVFQTVLVISAILFIRLLVRFIPFWIVDFFRDDEYSVSPNVTAAIFLIGLIVFLIWLSICFVRFIYRRYYNFVRKHTAYRRYFKVYKAYMIFILVFVVTNGLSFILFDALKFLCQKCI